MAFLDMGDQFLALAESDDRRPGPPAVTSAWSSTTGRACGRSLEEAGVEIEPSRGLRFRDPWGNLVEVVQYSEVQFTKAPAVLAGMGLEALGKSESAQQELRAKGLL